MIGHRPSTAVICGGSEIEQQAAMAGAERSRWRPAAVDGALRRSVGEHFGHLPFVSSSPTGGTLPFVNDVGVAHYFGVGAYVDPRRLPARPRPLRCRVPRLLGPSRARRRRGALRLGRGCRPLSALEAGRAARRRQLLGLRGRHRPLRAELSGSTRRAALGRSRPRLDCARAAVVSCFSSALSEWRSGDCGARSCLGTRPAAGSRLGLSDWRAGGSAPGTRCASYRASSRCSSPTRV